MNARRHTRKIAPVLEALDLRIAPSSFFAGHTYSVPSSYSAYMPAGSSSFVAPGGTLPGHPGGPVFGANTNPNINGTINY